MHIFSLLKNILFFLKEYELTGEKSIEIQDWLVNGWAIVMDMNKEQERIEEMKQKMPLVVNMVDMIKAGNKITEDDFTSAYGQLITAHPELAKESLEKMVGTFFEVLNK